jgi:hypothetical protein
MREKNRSFVSRMREKRSQIEYFPALNAGKKTPHHFVIVGKLCPNFIRIYWFSAVTRIRNISIFVLHNETTEMSIMLGAYNLRCQNPILPIIMFSSCFLKIIIEHTCLEFQLSVCQFETYFITFL